MHLHYICVKLTWNKEIHSWPCDHQTVVTRLGIICWTKTKSVEEIYNQKSTTKQDRNILFHRNHLSCTENFMESLQIMKVKGELNLPGELVGEVHWQCHVCLLHRALTLASCHDLAQIYSTHAPNFSFHACQKAEKWLLPLIWFSTPA